MASASALTNEMKGLGLTDSCTTSELAELEFHTVVECGSEHGSTSCCIVGSESVVAKRESGKCANNFEVGEQYESCKEMWSEVSELATNLDEDGDGAAEVENREVFKALQKHSIAPYFFRTFGYDLGVEGRGSVGELEIGEKFEEGGQAELFDVKVAWRDPKGNEDDQREGREWVLKVFKKGTLLRHLQSQWPQGYLQFRADEMEQVKLGKPARVRHYCNVMCATLLKDGRFAFLMVKEDGDLRSIIDDIMRRNVGRNQGPFEKEDAEMIMYRIALGMDWMHNHNILLRDLKAPNVLMRKHTVIGDWMSFIADFECSIGVLGTGFWRAPEVLQACKERNVFQRPELFTTQGDIYSYGMTCYEILTGRYPFDDHALRDYDLVLDGNRPEIPEYVEDWAQELLKWCWQTNPLDRPLVSDILKVLENNSTRVRRYMIQLKAKK